VDARVGRRFADQQADLFWRAVPDAEDPRLSPIVAFVA
jgi:hypothetical protein